MSSIIARIRCIYCGFATEDGADLHPICALEADESPLTAPLLSCPDSGIYPCDSCNPEER